ncbi:MAG TPA: NUDIX domain-containing protein [Rhizomicrobium sp.]|nr:NUDIX domain-containing protein [Rhizomicrobium sp.]
MISGFRHLVGQFSFGPVAMAIKALAAPVALGAHALIVDRNGRVALVRHSYKNGWSLPGGGVARGEPASDAILREMREELGDVRSSPPVLFGLYTRSSGWATNVIALYLLANAEVGFRPNFEVREMQFADPAALPDGTGAGTRRRVAEFTNKTPPSPYW